MIIKNHRSSGYSPFVTFTLLSADVETPNGKERIAVYIRRAKVPVWSFAEVIDPTFNQPLSLMVKEFSAKISALLFNHKISDSKVEELIAKTSKDEYVRQAAISSLGILKITE